MEVIFDSRQMIWVVGALKKFWIVRKFSDKVIVETTCQSGVGQFCDVLFVNNHVVFHVINFRAMFILNFVIFTISSRARHEKILFLREKKSRNREVQEDEKSNEKKMFCERNAVARMYSQKMLSQILKNKNVDKKC